MILGFDISTSVVGISCFSETGKLIKLHCVKLTGSKYKDLFDKFEKVKQELDLYKKNHDSGDKIVKSIAIEEPLKKMKGKFSNANTISILNFFNGMLSAYLFDAFGVKPIHYGATTARSLSFPDIKLREGSQKHQVLERVMKKEPKINWKYSPRTGKIDKTCYDMADAYVIGLTEYITQEKKKNNK